MHRGWGCTWNFLPSPRTSSAPTSSRYFHDVFHTPISEFKPSTNVRRAYSYSDRPGDNSPNVFNKLSWMRQLGVLVSPREMPDLNTIEDLTSAIWGKLSKVISVPGLTTPPLSAARRSRQARRLKGAVPIGIAAAIGRIGEMELVDGVACE